MIRKKSPLGFTLRILTLSTVLIVSGATLSLALKFQDQETFQHPFFMVQEAFMGELLALFWVGCPVLRSRQLLGEALGGTRRQLERGQRMAANARVWVCLGGLFDAFSSCFEIIGMVFLPAHLYLVSKNATIVFCVLFSVLVLRTRFARRERASLLVVLAGVGLVSASRLFSLDGDSQEQTGFGADMQTLFGLAVMLIAAAISGFHIVYQEHLFRTYALEPRELCGREGLVGTAAMTAVLLATSLMQCDNSLICEVGKAIDSPAEAFLGLLRNKQLLLAAYVSVFASTLFNVCGAALVQTNGAIFRTIVDSYRTLATSCVVLCLSLAEVRTASLVLQLAGTLLLVAGNYLYSRSGHAEPLQPGGSESMQWLHTE